MNKSGNIIRKLRKERNMTQMEIASELSVSHKTVSAWERGTRKINSGAIRTIIEKFDVDYVDFLKELSSKENEDNLEVYFCKVCQNVIISEKSAIVHCCGMELSPRQFESVEEINCTVEKQGEFINVSSEHVMEDGHYLTFILYVTKNSISAVKLAPGEKPQAVFADKGRGYILLNCYRHGMVRYEYGN